MWLINTLQSRSVASRYKQYVYAIFLLEGCRQHLLQPNNGHAFVLRRFDTGAISQTTMFRAAFPGCSEELEKVESNYVKLNYDSPGANGGPGKDALRLAGNWILPDVAAMLAPLYGLDTTVRSLVQASPDPNSEYRRSTKSTSSPAKENTSPAATAATATAVTTTATVAPASTDTPKPAKRRKESSPSPKKEPQPQGLQSPPPRRSVRLSSPPPTESPTRMRTRVTKTTTTKVTVKPRNARSNGMLTPNEEEGEEEEEEADVPGPDMDQDIEEQQGIIARLKAERAAQDGGASQISKRGREESEEQLQFQFREPEEQKAIATREIKTNRRLRLDLEPQQKSAAWGALWFAAGLAAA